MRNAKNASAIVLAALFLLLLLTLSVQHSDLIIGTNILGDADFEQGYPNPYWTRSTWGRSTAYYNYSYNPSELTMAISSVEYPSSPQTGSGYAGIGVFQGRKPYDWGISNHPFNKVLVDPEGELMVYWQGRLNHAESYNPLVSHINLGVNFWLTVEYMGQTEVAEVFVYLYQEGSGVIPLDDYRLITRTEKEGSWLYLSKHHTQIPKAQMTRETFNLAELIRYFKSASANEIYTKGDYYLTAVDCHLEAQYAEASYTLDFCGVMKTP